MMAGQHFCGEDWSELKKKHQSLDEEDLLRYCFSSAYIVALLHDSLEIALDDEGYFPALLVKCLQKQTDRVSSMTFRAL